MTQTNLEDIHNSLEQFKRSFSENIQQLQRIKKEEEQAFSLFSLSTYNGFLGFSKLIEGLFYSQNEFQLQIKEMNQLKEENKMINQKLEEMKKEIEELKRNQTGTKTGNKEQIQKMFESFKKSSEIYKQEMNKSLRMKSFQSFSLNEKSTSQIQSNEITKKEDISKPSFHQIPIQSSIKPKLEDISQHQQIIEKKENEIQIPTYEIIQPKKQMESTVQETIQQLQSSQQIQQMQQQKPSYEITHNSQQKPIYEITHNPQPSYSSQSSHSSQIKQINPYEIKPKPISSYSQQVSSQYHQTQPIDPFLVVTSGQRINSGNDGINTKQSQINFDHPYETSPQDIRTPIQHSQVLSGTGSFVDIQPKMSFEQSPADDPFNI